MKFSETEVSQLAKSWAVISFAFAISWYRFGNLLGFGFMYIYLIAALTVGMAFMVHEIAHKAMAQRYGCWAEFRSFDIGLILALVMSFVGGMVFAAPGAVMISGYVRPDQNGKIAIVGPITNICLALLFLLAQKLIVFDNNVYYLFVYTGYSINAWLAFFNLLPIPPLDGSKVFAWSRLIWLFMVCVSGYMVFSIISNTIDGLLTVLILLNVIIQ